MQTTETSPAERLSDGSEERTQGFHSKREGLGGVGNGREVSLDSLCTGLTSLARCWPRQCF